MRIPMPVRYQSAHMRGLSSYELSFVEIHEQRLFVVVDLDHLCRCATYSEHIIC
jgi:hypothetical protein